MCKFIKKVELKRFRFNNVLKQIHILRLEKEKVIDIIQKKQFDEKHPYINFYKRSSTSLNLYKKLYQYLLKKGNKQILEIKFKKGLEIWAKNLSQNKNFESIISSAFANIKPALSVKTKRKGSKNIYLPIGISSRKAFYLTSKWILTNSLEKNKRMFFENIVEELHQSALKKSASIKNRENLHKLVEDSLINIKF